MKKTLSILLVIILVSMTLVSCSDELLSKTGKFLKDFAGTEKTFSDAEIKEQTESVQGKANAMSTFLSATDVDDLKITSQTDTSELDAFIDSLLDNPACDMNAETNISLGNINKLREANNPILSIAASFGMEEDRDKVKTSLTDYKEDIKTSMTDMVKNELGEKVASTLESIIDIFTVLPTAEENASTKKATVKDVAAAASVAKMGSAISKLADLANGGGVEDFNSVKDIVSEYDNAAKSYMALTETTGLSIMDAVDINSLMDKAKE